MGDRKISTLCNGSLDLVCILVTPIQKRGEGLFRSLRTSVVNPMMISKCAARSLTTTTPSLLLRSSAIGNAALFNSKSPCKRTCLQTLTSTVTFRTMSSFYELSAKKIDGSEVRLIIFYLFFFLTLPFFHKSHLGLLSTYI